MHFQVRNTSYQHKTLKKFLEWVILKSWLKEDNTPIIVPILLNQITKRYHNKDDLTISMTDRKKQYADSWLLCPVEEDEESAKTKELEG